MASVLSPTADGTVLRANAELLGGLPSVRRVVAYALLVQRFSGQWARAVSLPASRFPWSGTTLVTPVAEPGRVLGAFCEWVNKLVLQFGSHPTGVALQAGWKWFQKWAPLYESAIEEALVGAGESGRWVRRYVTRAPAAGVVLAANEVHSAEERALLVPPSVAEELHRARFSGVTPARSSGLVLLGRPGSGKRSLAAAAAKVGATTFNAERALAELETSQFQTLRAAVRQTPGGVVRGDWRGVWDAAFWHVGGETATPDVTLHRVVVLPPPNAAARFAAVERGFRAALKEHTQHRPCTDARVDAHPAVRAAWKRVARFCGPNYARLQPAPEWETWARTRAVDVAPAERFSVLETARATAERLLREWSQTPPAVQTVSDALQFFERASVLLLALPRDSPRERVRAAAEALARSLREAEDGAVDLDAETLQTRALDVWFQGALAASEAGADAARRADVAELQELELEELRARDDREYARRKEQLPKADQNELWAFAASGEPPDAWLPADEGPAKAARRAARAAASWRSHFTRTFGPLRAARVEWEAIGSALLNAAAYFDRLHEIQQQRWTGDVSEDADGLTEYTVRHMEGNLARLRELVPYERSSAMDPESEFRAAVSALTAGNAVLAADAKKVLYLQPPPNDLSTFQTQLDAERRYLLAQLDAAALSSSKTNRQVLQQAHAVLASYGFGLDEEKGAKVDVRLQNVLEPVRRDDAFQEESAVDKNNEQTRYAVAYWQMKICKIWSGWVDCTKIPTNVANITLDADLHALASELARVQIQQKVQAKLAGLYAGWLQAFRSSTHRAELSKLYDELFANALARYHLRNAKEPFDLVADNPQTLQEWTIKTAARGTEEAEGVKAALRAAQLHRVEAPTEWFPLRPGTVASGEHVEHVDDSYGFEFAPLEHASYRAAKAALNAHVRAELGGPTPAEDLSGPTPAEDLRGPTPDALDQLLCSTLAHSDVLVRNFQLAQRALTFDYHSKHAAQLGESVARHFEAYFYQFLPAARGFSGTPLSH